MSNWISVDDALPTIFMDVVVFQKLSEACCATAIAYRDREGKWLPSAEGLWGAHGVELTITPTHWMPLPQLPEVVE